MRCYNGPMRVLTGWFLAALFACNASAQPVPAPLADHHQHLLSPMMAQLIGTPSVKVQPIVAKDVITLLDAAGIRQALLLSTAYIYGSPSRKFEDEYDRVRDENDWNAQQAALYPGRLVAFCGINPLRAYALLELARCAKDPRLARGIKLHFGNSDVQLENPLHLEEIKRVFAAANANRMAIVVHLRASISRQRPYGAEQARIFLEQVLPAAPDVLVQVAHFAGSGPGYDDAEAQAAMGVLAEARERNDPRARNLWFDVATIVDPAISPLDAFVIAKRIRQVGIDRVLYGSDAAAGDNLRPREGWAAFRKLPLEPDEFRRIAGNVAPYLR